MTGRARAVAAFLVLIIVPPAACAQVLASEHGVVAQTVDGTTFTVEYYRPQARGRDSLFGKVVRFGDQWTPGANWATTLAADKDAQFEGKPLPKGKYSIWMIPQSSGPWTVILSKKAKEYHTSPPGQQDDLLRTSVQTTTVPPVEVLTFSFPEVRPDGATLQMQWGTTAVRMRLGVTPTKPVGAIDPPKALVGRYALVWDGPQDSPGKMTLEVFEGANGLRGRGDGMQPFSDQEFDLIPAGSHRYHPGYYSNGNFAGVETDLTYVFQLKDGVATGFEVLGTNDEHIGRAKRQTP